MFPPAKDIPHTAAIANMQEICVEYSIQSAQLGWKHGCKMLLLLLLLVLAGGSQCRKQGSQKPSGADPSNFVFTFKACIKRSYDGRLAVHYVHMYIQFTTFGDFMIFKRRRRRSILHPCSQSKWSFLYNTSPLMTCNSSWEESWSEHDHEQLNYASCISYDIPSCTMG